MERVVFLTDPDNRGRRQRIACLLNPESLVLKRRAGLKQRQSAGGLVTGSALADDPIFITGGGRTELTLNLLFDVQLPGVSEDLDDVRELTGVFWNLAENSGSGPDRRRPRRVTMQWGKAMQFSGFVASIAERLEYFTRNGVPRRAWVRMRLVRSVESEDELRGGALPPPRLPDDLGVRPVLPQGPSVVHALAKEGGRDEPEPASSSERLDFIAYQYFGDPSQWRVLAWLNDIADPLRLDVGLHIEIAAEWDIGGGP